MIKTINLLTLCPRYSQALKEASGWTFYEVKQDYLRGYSTPGKRDQITNRITILNALFFNTEFQMSFRKQGENIVPSIFRVRLRNRVKSSYIITRDFIIGSDMYIIHSNQEEATRISFDLEKLDHMVFCIVDSLLDQATDFFRQNF